MGYRWIIKGIAKKSAEKVIRNRDFGLRLKYAPKIVVTNCNS